MPPSLPYTLVVIITISLVDPLLTTEQVEDEWVEYEVDSLFSSYKDFEPFDDNEELWHEDDYKEYDARSDDFFQSTSTCQPIPLPIKDQYTSLIPSNDPTLTSTSTIGKSSLLSNTSGMSTPSSPAQKTISEVSKSSNAIPTPSPTSRIVVKQRREITTSTPKLATQVPTTLTTVKPTTVESNKEQTGKPTTKTTMMVSEIKLTSSTFKTITGEAYTTSNMVQSSCDCSKCNVVATTISTDESSTDNEELNSEKPKSGKGGKKKITHKPLKKKEKSQPETEVEITESETETEPSTIETEQPTTEATEEEETPIRKERKKPTPASNTEIASETEKTAMQTPKGIKNNIKNKTTVKSTKARSHSKDILDFNEGPMLFNVVKNNTKRNNTSKAHKNLFFSTGVQ